MVCLVMVECDTQSFEKVYGIKPQLEPLGSADELFKLMHKIRDETPHEFFKYMTLYVPPTPPILFPPLFHYIEIAGACRCMLYIIILGSPQWLPQFETTRDSLVSNMGHACFSNTKWLTGKLVSGQNWTTLSTRTSSPLTWEDLMRSRTLEQLAGAYFALGTY